MEMTHPGLPFVWLLIIALASTVVLIKVFSGTIAQGNSFVLPLFGSRSARERMAIGETSANWLLLTLKIASVTVFGLIIACGLIGTPIAERNIATVLTWNIWWAGLIVSIVFLGSSWCAICPWDALATWLVRRRLWRRAIPNNSLNLRFPKVLRNAWPSIVLLIGLTWLELGVGLTSDPYLTAVTALAMVVMATMTLAVYEKKAFCRFVCPVGRTVGAYAQLAPVELRPVDPSICAHCTTMECYHGSSAVEPCPTQLVMGTLEQSTYCTSCGNCQQSCPSHNVGWRLRSPTREIGTEARPRIDTACFTLGLLALTSFHGVTMIQHYDPWLRAVARVIGDSGQLIASFTIMMIGSMILPVLIFVLAITVMARLAGAVQNDCAIKFPRLFSSFAFTALPIAFAYHLAHNLNHLIREVPGVAALLADPFGFAAVPLSMVEKHSRYNDMLISQDALFALQSGLMLFGVWLSFRIVRQRGELLGVRSALSLSPMIVFVIAMTSLHCWMLAQPMTMRM